MPSGPKDRNKSHRTQWSTQFLAAAELTRRGYTVSFTMGNNTPVADLMVGAPSGNQFWVDVKGLSSRNAWLLSIKPDRPNLFYILVCLAPLANKPKMREPDRFFILNQAEANKMVREYMASHPNDKGKRTGFAFKDSLSAEDAWEKLPD